MKVKRFICEVLLFFVAFSVVPMKKYGRTEIVMGTILNIQFFSNKKNAAQILNEAFEIAAKYDRIYSSKQAYGEVYRLNQTGFIDNSDIYSMLREADFYNKLTDGFFDYTLFPLIKLWNIENASSPPSNENIADVLKNCGTDKVTFENGAVTLCENAAVDVGGIAKGKILQLIANYLKSQETENFIINGGGDIVLSGLFNGKRKWNIAVKDPFSENGVIGYIQTTDIAIVTSGDYERFFVAADGTRYHHIFNPKTGYPAQSGVSSVTVVSADSIRADALSTSLFVMGKDAGIDFVNKQENAEAIFVGKEDGRQVITCSSGISEKSIDGIRYFTIHN